MKISHVDPLEERLRQALDARAAGLDRESIERLRTARQEALAGSRSGGRLSRWLQGKRLTDSGWIPAAAMASALLIGVTMLLVQHGGQQGDVPVGDQFDALLVSEELDLYQQLDFYLWLDQTPEVMQQTDHKT